jgi:hypothetical protein
MAPYHRLSLIEREELSRMLAAGASQMKVPGTISSYPFTLNASRDAFTCQ